jgi:hypothetical protein
MAPLAPGAAVLNSAKKIAPIRQYFPPPEGEVRAISEGLENPS